MPDYPTDEMIERIRAWEFTARDSFEQFMSYVRAAGHYWTGELTFGWYQDGRRYEVSTGGWSGNEEIVGAMQANLVFWAVCWQSSRRGGHFVFDLPDPVIYFGEPDQG